MGGIRRRRLVFLGVMGFFDFCLMFLFYWVLPYVFCFIGFCLMFEFLGIG